MIPRQAPLCRGQTGRRWLAHKNKLQPEPKRGQCSDIAMLYRHPRLVNHIRCARKFIRLYGPHFLHPDTSRLHRPATHVHRTSNTCSYREVGIHPHQAINTMSESPSCGLHAAASALVVAIRPPPTPCILPSSSRTVPVFSFRDAALQPHKGDGVGGSNAYTTLSLRLAQPSRKPPTLFSVLVIILTSYGVLC